VELRAELAKEAEMRENLRAEHQRALDCADREKVQNPIIQSLYL
jgi:hypothetical protein